MLIIGIINLWESQCKLLGNNIWIKRLKILNKLFIGNSFCTLSNNIGT